MSKPRFALVAKPVRLNVGNVEQRLRRIRTELALILQQVDDGLARIEEEKAWTSSTS